MSPRTTQHPEGSSDQNRHIQAYWAALFDGPFPVRLNTLRTPGITESLLVELVERTGDDDVDELCAWNATSNPCCPTRLLLRWARGERGRQVAEGAVAHPALGPRAPRLHEELTECGASYARNVFANPGAPPEFIADAAALGDTFALANPTCPIEEIHAALNKLTVTGKLMYPDALRHPGIDPAVLDAVIEGGDDLSRVRVAENPAMDAVRLQRLIDTEASRSAPNVALIAAGEWGLARLRWASNPLAGPAEVVRYSPFHPTVAAVVDILTGDAAAGMRSLLDAGFGGTVAELFEVARTFS